MKKIRIYLIIISFLLPWIVYYNNVVPKANPLTNFPQNEIYLTSLLLMLLALFWKQDNT
mgnify:CR=1 FL=1